MRPCSLVTSRRLRDGNVIGLGYDALGRLVSKDLPSIAVHEYDVAYSYDLQGRLTEARDSNTHFASFTYDALGRKLSETSNFFGPSHSYDLAGRRTRLTHGDGPSTSSGEPSSSTMTIWSRERRRRSARTAGWRWRRSRTTIWDAGRA